MKQFKEKHFQIGYIIKDQIDSTRGNYTTVTQYT